jgi:hypothetical protein
MSIGQIWQQFNANTIGQTFTEENSNKFYAKCEVGRHEAENDLLHFSNLVKLSNKALVAC